MSDKKNKDSSKEDLSKEDLSKEDLIIAKKAMKNYLKSAKKLVAVTGANAVFNALGNLLDKFSRNDKGELNRGWFYGFITSNILSGASAELLEHYLVSRHQKIELAIKNQLHQEFDNFSITERNLRNPEKVKNDEKAMIESTQNYLNAKSSLISTVVAVGAMTSMTLASGGLSNLPIMGLVMLASATSSYFINKKMNKSKIKQNNKIREIQGELDVQNRHMYTNSLEREINDPSKKEYAILQQKEDIYSSRYNKFIKMLCKYAATGTLIKTAIIGAAIAFAHTNPTNMLVLATAALTTYHAMNRFVNNVFSLKEHLGNFANAYKSFKPKVNDIDFGTKKIKSTANVIELDNISFNHRQADDITKKSDNTLFNLNGTIRISPGITILSGASGAGKSSLINLLIHSDKLENGAIRIGEIDNHQKFISTDYNDLKFGEPARHIGFDLQLSKLSYMSVNDYITMANPNASPQLIAEVKELVGIKDKPQNNTDIPSNLILGTTDKHISGGQISRLKLAQTLIKDSPIMVLDEPLTGIDQTLCKSIVSYLNKIKDNKTIVYITHNTEEINNLNTYQAIDIDKKENETTATISLYDLTDKNNKSQYLNLFTNRKSSPSPENSENLESSVSSPAAETPSLFEQLEKAEAAVKRNQEALERAQKQLEKLKALKTAETTEPQKQTDISAHTATAANAFNARFEKGRT